jgi:regulator of protease activity HflC (stomatin/prohibitin superfamily)
MKVLIIVVVVVMVLVLITVALAVRLVWQYEQGVLFRLGRLRGARAPGLRLIVRSAIDQIAQTTLRKVVGHHS